MKPDPNILYLNFPYNENIASLLKVWVKNTCNIDENVILAKKKKTWKKIALLLDKDKNVAPAKKKRT